MNTWVYAGSFDPVTNGHVDVIERAANICDRLVVGILVNPSKAYAFTMEERMDMIRRVTGHLNNVVIDGFRGLLVNFLHKHNANVIIKGLRAVSDYEYELQMAHLNQHIDESIETLFMMSSLSHNYISSSVVKELAKFGGEISGLVPKELEEKIRSRIKNES